MRRRIYLMRHADVAYFGDPERGPPELRPGDCDAIRDEDVEESFLMARRGVPPLVVRAVNLTPDDLVHEGPRTTTIERRLEQYLVYRRGTG